MIEFTDKEIEFLMNALTFGHEFNINPTDEEASSFDKLEKELTERGVLNNPPF